MRTAFLTFVYGILMRNFLRIIVGVKWQNKEALNKEKQFIIVANHNSHVDTMALMSALPSSKIKFVHPVAAGDYFGKSKIKAFFTRLFVNALLIPRSRPAEGETGPDPVQMMFDELQRGHSLILFPEGSRGEPEKLQKFKRGIGFILQKFPHVPYIPVFMSGMGKILPKGDNVLVPFNSFVLFGEPTKCKSSSPEEIAAEVEASTLALKDRLPDFILKKLNKDQQPSK